MTLNARLIRIAAFCGLACVFISCGSAFSPSALAASAAPAVSLSATSLSPGWFPVGTKSQSTNLFVTNSGAATLWITSVTLTGPNQGDFALNNGCASSLAAGANCLITFTFTPTGPGTRTAYININDNAPGTTGWGVQTATIYGTGEGATASLSAGSLTFASLAVGTTSAAQTLTLSNAGNESLSISSLGLAGANPSDFWQSNNCGSSVAAGSSCTISVAFKPAAGGTFTATLALADNVPGSPQTVPLTGTGAAVPAANPSPGGLTFSSKPIGNPAPAQIITLSNPSSTALSISSIAITGISINDFAQTNTCGISLGAGSACTISVTFTPTASGVRYADVTVTDNAAGSPQTVPLTGTGAAVPAANPSPGSLTFSSKPIGNPAPAQIISLSNPGSAALSITSIAITGTSINDFAQTNTCGSSLGVGGACTITVTFTPTASGARYADITLADNAAGSPQVVGLSGTGTSTAATVSLSPTSLSFGNQATDTTSSLQTVTLTNTGSTALTIASLALTGTNAGDFTQNNNCNSPLAAGGSCTISILFTPAASGAATASLQVTDNASTSPQVATLAGAGTHDVILTWAAVTSGNVAGYNVFRGTSPGGENSAPLNSSPVNGTSYTDGGVSAGVTYYYVLKAVGANGTQSAASNEMSTVVP